MTTMSHEIVPIDGSLGEGGGQILRSSLALSMVTGRPVQLSNIRAGRSKPGLLRQHLTAVEAAARVSHARIEGAALGSTDLVFYPQQIQHGRYEFAIGTAGSTTLVLQTLLPALMLAAGPSSVRVEGGTHNPWAPPFEFLAQSFAPQLHTMGVDAEFTLHRAGFHPAGGGRVDLNVRPPPQGRLRPFSLFERGALRGLRAEAIVAHLPPEIAERELGVIRARLGVGAEDAHVRVIEDSAGPGNCVLIYAAFEHGIQVTTAFGRKGLSAERVARSACAAAKSFLASEVPVDEFLADQLLLPGALAEGGGFRTGPLSPHASTNIEVIGRFLDVPIRVDARDGCTDVHFGS